MNKDSEYMDTDHDEIPVDEWILLFEDRMDAGQTLKVSPRGFSMYPLLVGKRDDIILGKPDTSLKRGDICMFRRDNGVYVLHTIHHKDGDNYFFVGESQTRIEGPIREEQIVARAQGFVRNGKAYSCNNFLFRVIHELWLRLRVFRPMLIRSYRFVRRI